MVPHLLKTAFCAESVSVSAQSDAGVEVAVEEEEDVIVEVKIEWV
ncbi:hypothetical protein FACS189472_14390 [Alphaproteobacteria bacterium]|nr:hypothetical protein FACS189472_14390 [Alphaproteobacteria bacterium]